MKNIILITVLFCTLQVTAQFKKGKIYLKDKTEKTGLIKLRTFGGLKFKDKKDSEIQVYTIKQLSGYDLNNEQYKYFKTFENAPTKLLKLETKGNKVDLYSQHVSGPGIIDSNGGFIPGTGASATLYYIKKHDDIIYLGRRIGNSKFKYFEDCPKLIKKIKAKEIKKRHITKIVNFYNEQCN